MVNQTQIMMYVENIILVATIIFISKKKYNFCLTNHLFIIDSVFTIVIYIKLLIYKTSCRLFTNFYICPSDINQEL